MTNIKHLYKYGKITQHSKSLFSTSKVYLCSAEKLNDPFECRPRYAFRGTRAQIVGSLSRGALGTNPLMTPHRAMQIANKMYTDGKHRDVSMHTKAELSFTEMSTKKVGIYCLSEVVDSILMWSHYADSHQGYCIEFEATDSTPFFCEAQRVKYSPKYPIIEHWSMSPGQKMDLAFLTKHNGWRYEREWRILGNVRGPGHYVYPSHLMKRVIFGLATNEATKKKIRRWVEQRKDSVQFSQAVRNPERFAIDIVPL